jgi:hypothetical protein
MMVARQGSQIGCMLFWLYIFDCSWRCMCLLNIISRKISKKWISLIVLLKSFRHDEHIHRLCGGSTSYFCYSYCYYYYYYCHHHACIIMHHLHHHATDVADVPSCNTLVLPVLDGSSSMFSSVTVIRSLHIQQVNHATTSHHNASAVSHIVVAG